MNGRHRETRAANDCPGDVLPREMWTRTRVGLGEAGQRFDWDATFGRRARRVVDLGCGNGRFVILSGLARPDVDHLGVELVPPAIRMGSLRAGQRGLTNVKFAWGDATEFICERATPGSIDEVHLYHPQPYYDRDRIDRRQLTPRTLLATWRALAPLGLFVFQTDNPAYMSYARRHVSALFEWREFYEPWPDAPAGRTQREMLARSQKLTIFRAQAVRLTLEDAEAERRAALLPEPEFDANKPGFVEGGPQNAMRQSERRRQNQKRKR